MAPEPGSPAPALLRRSIVRLFQFEAACCVRGATADDQPQACVRRCAKPEAPRQIPPLTPPNMPTSTAGSKFGATSGASGENMGRTARACIRHVAMALSFVVLTGELRQARRVSVAVLSALWHRLGGWRWCRRGAGRDRYGHRRADVRRAGACSPSAGRWVPRSEMHG